MDVITWKLARVVKDEAVAALRVAFKLHPDFGTDEINLVEPEKSLLVVTTEYFQSIQKYPIVAISNFASRSEETGIGGYGFDTDTQEIYTGRWHTTLSIDCAALTTHERDRLSDWVAEFMLWPLRKHFWELGINVTSVTQSGEREVPYGRNFIYISGVNVDVWTEWVDKRTLGTVEDVEVILAELRACKAQNNLTTCLEALEVLEKSKKST